MAKKIEALVLKNICLFNGGIVRKGNVARLTGKEMEHFVAAGAVERPKFVAKEEPKKEPENVETEGGDA